MNVLTPLALRIVSQYTDMVHEWICKYTTNSAPHYSEPGYTNPEKCILFSNWNDVPDEVQKILEKQGFELEWDDEWTTCIECCGAVRTSPDSYFFKLSFWESREGPICHKCILKDESIKQEYLTRCLDNVQRAITIDGIDLTKYGFEKEDKTYQRGLHEHMKDTPQLMPGYHVIFTLDEQSQFYHEFSRWFKKKKYQCGACDYVSDEDEYICPKCERKNQFDVVSPFEEEV